MNHWKTASAAALIACVPQPALAESRVVQAVPIGRGETVRYDRGVPTLDMKQRAGAVQVTPLGIEHGNIVFGVAVYNDGPLPAAFDHRNIQVTSGGMPVPVLSPETLASKAKSRSIWRMVALAAVGGVAAVASANQTDTYRTRVRTPRGGSYRITQTGPSAAGQFNAALITAGTSAGIATIQSRLDEARQRIGMETLQLTTVEPGTSYGGRVTLARLKPGPNAQQIALGIDWNGEHYDFAFRVAAKGAPMPVFAAPVAPPALTPAVLLPVARPVPRSVEIVAAPTVAAPNVAAAPIMVSYAPPPAPLPSARPIMAMTAPVRIAGPTTEYEAKLAAARGVRGREPKQGWTITD